MTTFKGTDSNVQASPTITRAKPKTITSLEMIDRWIIVLLVIAFTALPALLKLQMSDESQSNPLLKQLMWSFMYLACGVRLLQMGMFKEVLSKLSAIWVFCAYMLLTAAWSVDSSATIVNSIELIGSTVIGCYLATRFELGTFIRILGWIFAITIVLTGIFLTVFRNHGYSFFGSGAWVGFFPEKNLLGASMSLGILTFSGLFAGSKGRLRFLAAVGMIASAILLFGSNSITSIIVVVLVASVIGSLALWQSKRFGVIGRFIVLLGIITVALLYLSGFSMDTVLTMVGRTPSLSGRDEMWPFVKQAIADRPIVGYGYNAFFRSELARGFFYSVAAFNNRPPFHAHNSFLQILIAGGYLGLFIFLVGLLRAFWNSVRYCMRGAQRAAFWPLATLLFLTVGSIDETYFPVINSFEWLVFVAASLYATRAMAAKTATAKPTPQT
jgi:exopolysaccharide production protein ExoQ